MNIKENLIHTVLGDGMTDKDGAAVAVARMDVKKSYKGVGPLLQKVIRDADETAWHDIKAKINYTFENVDAALTALEKETGFLLGGLNMSTKAEEDESEPFRAFYAMLSNVPRHSNPLWNPGGHDFTREQVYGLVTVVAQLMSQSPKEEEDPFFTGLLWGKGKWPSYALAFDRYVKQVLYGWKYPARIGISSLYGSACAFADHRQNGRQFLGNVRGVPDPETAQKYVEAVREGRMKPLDFTFYALPGYGGSHLPNVEESSDPAKVLTVIFEGGTKRWPDPRTEDLESNS